MAPASNITDHDQLFKRLFEAFLPQYVELFYPEFAGRMDFSRIVFHQQDLYTDHPVGDRYVLDVVAEVGPDGGEGKVVVLHVAIEYDRRTGIAAEMYEAYKWLQARFRDPILPLVVYLTTGAGGRREEVHQECVFGHEILRFKCFCLGLAGLDGVQYREEANPLGPALAALMRHPGESRVKHKAECLLGLARTPVTDAERALLQHVVETYLPLDAAEEQEFQAKMATPAYAEIDYTISPFEQRGRIRGEEIGRAAGEEIGRANKAREILTQFLQTRFGALTAEQAARIQTADEAWCDERLRRLPAAATLTELDLD